MRNLWIIIGLSLVIPDVIVAAPPKYELVTEWNQLILEVAEQEDGFLTLKGVRTTALAHLAMHDALSHISGLHKPYRTHRRQKKANPVAAATQAAFAIAVSQYPNEESQFAALNTKWLASVTNNKAKRLGTALGDATAKAVLDSRLEDGWATDPQYQWHPMAPGVYAEFNEHSGTPAGFIFGAGWAQAKGFALTNGDQFRSPPPPAITSAAYKKAYDEVRQWGRYQSQQRTPDQTHIALWWKDFAESSHNRLGRQLAAKEQLSLEDSARFFALLNMSVFDAYVSSFNNKFHYNHWRPYTAIRWADNDGNPNTIAEPDWNNTHRHTYAFPSYPSAHGTACAAAMTVFADVFGDEYAFKMETAQVDIAGPFSEKITMHPTHRSFEKFSDAAMECALSRIYLGIHFRYDSEAGFDLGRDVGSNVVQTLLRKR